MAKKVKSAVVKEKDPQKAAEHVCQNSLGRIAGGFSSLSEERKSLKDSPVALSMLNSAMAAKAAENASEHEQRAGRQWGLQVLSQIKRGNSTASLAYAMFKNCVSKKVGEIAAKTLQEKLAKKE